MQFGQSNQPQIRQALDKRNLVRHKQLSRSPSPKDSLQQMDELYSFTRDEIDNNTE